MDVIVLACTHFPLLRPELEAAAPGVVLIDSGEGIARRIAFLTNGQDWPAAPDVSIALFTALFDPCPGLRARFARFGLSEIRFL